MRISIIVVGAVAAVMGIVVKSVYGLWYLCGDLVYVILFPQLLCIVHMEFTNEAGAWAGYILGMFFRLTGGEPLLGLPPLIKYPWYYDDPDPENSDYQLFPFKTLCMLICLVTTIVVSLIARTFIPRFSPSNTYEMQKYSDKENIGTANPGFQRENNAYPQRDNQRPNTLSEY